MLRAAPLETPRLSIRRFAPDDTDWLVALFADPRVARFVDDGGQLSRDDAALWVERSNANVERYGYGTGAVIARGSGARIGWAGVARPGDGSEEIIYGLAAAHWGQGFGGEIVAALVGWLDANRPGEPIRATIDSANLVSAHLLERNGFRLASSNAGSDFYLRDQRTERLA